MRKASSPRKVYLDVLGFKSQDELTNHIACSIQREIHAQRGGVIPVAVSSAARAFDIKPEPVFAEMPRDGSIQFDPLEHKFVIRINQSGYPNTRSLLVPDNNECSPELSMYYRSRFTYAHEFAHRFFFVSGNSGWQRAIDIATEGLRKDAHQATFRSLLNYEETLCNRIAGDVLVPQPHLARILGDSLENIDRIHHALRGASHQFRVSQECLLVVIRRAVLRSQIRCPSNLCIFVITNSDRKGGESRSRRDLRIREAVMPSNVVGVSVKPIFPGLAIRNLGQEALSTAAVALGQESRGYPSPANLVVNLAKADGTGSVVTRLTGWTSPLYSGRAPADGILLWGLLNS